MKLIHTTSPVNKCFYSSASSRDAHNLVRILRLECSKQELLIDVPGSQALFFSELEMREDGDKNARNL